MASDALQIELSQPNGARVLSLRGELDLASAPQLRHSLAEALNGSSEVVLDMEGVTFMDSSGINALLEATKESEEQQVTLHIRNPSTAVQQLLRITGLAEHFGSIADG